MRQIGIRSGCRERRKRHLVNVGIVHTCHNSYCCCVGAIGPGGRELGISSLFFFSCTLGHGLVFGADFFSNSNLVASKPRQNPGAVGHL